VRGGASWHGGASAVAYTNCLFEGNIGLDGDDAKGTALRVTQNGTVSVAGSLFLRNIGGAGIADGTVSLAGTLSHLTLSDTTFDGNTANLGGCLFITVESQTRQLSMSGLTFRNNFAWLAASLLFTEAEEYTELNCSPLPCDTSVNNTAALARQTVATPPKHIAVAMPAAVRSGAPLSLSITLFDGFNQTVGDWRDTTATIETGAALTGSVRAFYANGAAAFSGLVLKGAQNASYELHFTLLGPELFGTGVDTKSIAQNVTVQPCEAQESFDPELRICECASGFGLKPDTGACVFCAADEVVPDEGGPCVACPALSLPTSLYACGCIAGYFGSISGATGACTQCPTDTYRRCVLPLSVCLPAACTADDAPGTLLTVRTTRAASAARAPPPATPLRWAPPPRRAACAGLARTASATTTAAPRACLCRTAATRCRAATACWP
jgi:hypothetical protein